MKRPGAFIHQEGSEWQVYVVTPSRHYLRTAFSFSERQLAQLNLRRAGYVELVEPEDFATYHLN